MIQLSIIMGVRCPAERSPQLERAIWSILQQEYFDFEFLICDDGSSNEAKMLLDQLAKVDTRIRLLRSGNLYMLPHKLNYCLKYAQGLWIARMDDDDFAYPSRFKVQLDFLKANPQYAFVGCNVKETLSQKVIGERVLPFAPKPRDFQFSMPFVHPTLVFKRAALHDIGGYSEDKFCLLCEDYDLLLRMYAKGYEGANVQEVLFEYSVDGILTKRRKLKYRFNEVITRYRRFKDLNMLPRAVFYVVKPLLVAMIPLRLLNSLKKLHHR